jgi:hypothetical protein
VSGSDECDCDCDCICVYLDAGQSHGGRCLRNLENLSNGGGSSADHRRDRASNPPPGFRPSRKVMQGEAPFRPTSSGSASDAR